MAHENFVSTTEDWIEGRTLTSYDLKSISGSPNNTTALIVTQADFDLQSANRPLREKARGEMSAFEREYPW